MKFLHDSDLSKLAVTAGIGTFPLTFTNHNGVSRTQYVGSQQAQTSLLAHNKHFSAFTG